MPDEPVSTVTTKPEPPSSNPMQPAMSPNANIPLDDVQRLGPSLEDQAKAEGEPARAPAKPARAAKKR